MIAGPGFADAEGVYHLGEADNADDTFSGLMQMVTEPISDQFTLDRARLAAIETAVPRVVALGKSANQALATGGAGAAITWDVEISDAAAMHAAGNPSRIVAVTAGLYQVTAQVYVNATSGTATIWGRLNGTTAIRGSAWRALGGTHGSPVIVDFPVVLAVNDYVELMVIESAAAFAVGGGTTEFSSTVTMKKIA